MAKFIVPLQTSITHSKTYSYADIAMGKDFSFTANATDPKDDSLTYNWGVESKNVDPVNSTTTQSKLLIDPSSIMNRPTYDVLVRSTVTNKFGNTDSMSATTTVIGDADANEAPVASFKVNSDTLEQGATIEVQSNSEDEIAAELTNKWGVTFNGQAINVDQSKGVIASFTASEAGDYQVTLLVSDVFSVEDTVTEMITVTAIQSTWDPEAIYNTGDTVIHGGVTYTAQWWTQGDVPGVADVWVAEDDGTTKEWNATSTYNAGDTVIYNGVTYTAKWWTKGDVPGTADVWVAEDDGTTKAWNATSTYNTGDTAIHDGVTYSAKWWTKGDVPGVSDVWTLMK